MDNDDRPVANDRQGIWLPPRAARRAVAIGVLAALAVALWFISQQRLGLAAREYSSNFYDQQARSWLRGTWSMPQKVLKLEGVEIDGAYHMYFGPFPSILRMPVLLLTDKLDGRLAQPSLLLAYLVLLISVVSLWWQIRRLVRGMVDPTRSECVAGGVAVFAVGVCSLYLTNLTSTAVYMEAIAWGVSLSLLSFALLVAALTRYRTGTAAGAVVAAGAATLTRVTVGGGALIAIWMVGAVWLVAWWAHGRTGSLADRSRRLVARVAPTLRNVRATPRTCAVWLGGALSFSIAYVAINYVRFRQLFSIPWDAYVYNRYSTGRQLALAANDGSLMGLKFVPTTLWNYLRPDAVEFDRHIPWINFPRRGVTSIGDVVLDITAPSSSLTATMPLFLLLGLVGLVVVVRRLSHDDDGIGSLRIPIISALLGTGGIWMAAFLAHRYMTDAVPFLVLVSFIGHHVLARSLIGTHRRPWRLAMNAVSIGLLAWGAAVNIALSVENQKLIWPNTEDVRYEFVTRQYEGETGPIPEVDEIPTPGPRGEMVTVGDCEALLWSNGGMWVILEGEVTPERWWPPPGELFFDLDVAPTTVRTPRPPVLCRQLTGR